MKETEQTLLDQIKDQVAVGYGFQNWKHMSQNSTLTENDKTFNLVCERYATAKAQASCEAKWISVNSHQNKRTRLLH